MDKENVDNVVELSSQDLFSDEDHIRDPNFQSPKFIKRNESLNSSIVSLKTPILFSKVKDETPGKACIPRTPAGLLPYIKKTNISWCSDMETPKSRLLAEMPNNCNITANSIDIQQSTPPKRPQSPNNENLVNNMSTTSPVLGGKKRAKRKVKRRILSNVTTTDADNNNEQSTTTPNSDYITALVDQKLPAKRNTNSSVEITSLINNKGETSGVTKNKIINNDSLKSSTTVVQEEKKKEATDCEKICNTSTQEFFCNVSLSAIDNICKTWAASEKKEDLNSNNGEAVSNVTLETIKEEVIDEKESEITSSISQDVLDRVAAIRRNQKPMRRSGGIIHVPVPKEAFHQTALYLEQADMNDINSSRIKFHQENKKSQTVHNKLSNLASFTSLASFEKEAGVKSEKLSIEDKVVIKSEQLSIKNCQIQNVPNEMMDDWNTQFIDDVDKKENLKRSMPVIDDPEECDNDANICRANGKGTARSEINLQKRLKINEIESEIKNSEDLPVEKCNSKKISKKAPNHLNNQKRFNDLQNHESIIKSDIVSTNNQLYENTNKEKDEFSFVKPSTSEVQEEKSTLLTNKINHTKKTEVLKLYEQLDLNEFLAPNFDSKIEGSANGDCPTDNKNMKISDEKEKYYNELLATRDESDFAYSKKSVILQSSTLQINSKAVVVFDSKENLSNEIATTSKIFEETVSDGFSTAGGKNIAVNNDKLNYFLNLYNNLNDTDESSFLNIKKNKASRLDNLPRSKALIIFNNKENSLNAKTVGGPSKKVNIEKRTKDVISDSFATASGKGIQISEEKETHYKKIYNQLSEDVTDVNSVLLPNKKKINNAFVSVKPDVSSVKKENCDTDSKLQMNSDSDEGFYNIDMDKLFLPNEAESQTKNATISAPISTNDPKSQQQVQISAKSSISESEPSLLKDRDQNMLQNKQGKSHMGVLLKRKLDSSEVKKPERCRSFGGYSVADENVSAAKLNKTDPQEESHVNPPLQKGLSTSQCFDSNFDSFLSKMELSFLNNSKIKSPDTKVEKSSGTAAVIADKCAIEDEETSDFLGFSFKECVESFRLYAKVKRFLDKQSASKEFVFKVPENRSMKQNDLTVKNEEAVEKVKAVEKRKHSDTDSDTPLTTLKKPRVGSELQGRRLFSDESDEENDGSIGNKVDNEPRPLEPQVIPQEEEDNIEEEANFAEKRFNALLLQEKVIRNKKRIKVKQTLGNLLKERIVNNKNRVSWSQLVGECVPKTRSIEEIIADHPDAKILEVTASNATCYKFLTANIIGNKKTASLDVGDGALLIFDDNGHAGISEFKEAFLAMPGVDPKLIPTGWVENHYKWIIWKLASMDRNKFNSIQLPKILTPERVMQELKYRYDREIDRAQRPALRKILEKDDVPCRRMVLCISSITEVTSNAEDTEKGVRSTHGLSRWKIEATDGWYSIPLTIDTAMQNYVSTGKIKEGTKIITFGAKLLECERGFHPLDKPTNISLQIYSNSTRRAKWDTKLGYCMNSRPIPIKLRDIVPSGGTIGETMAVAARVYPILYIEKTADGQSIYRNAKSEEKAAIAHEQAVEKKLELMYAEAEKKFESKKQSDSDEDADNSQASEPQGKLCGKSWEMKCEKRKQKLESEVREGLPPQRNVTPVLKVRLVHDNTVVTLTIWGADEELNYDIKEGCTYTIYNSFAHGSWSGELNLKVNRQSHIRVEPLLKLPYPPRICTLIPDIGVGFEPKFNEVDTVGVVVSLGAAPHGMKNFEMVNLAYPKPNDAGSSYLTILFWDGVSSFGYQGMLTVGSFVACSNLEWRRNFSWSVAVLYCSEKTVFTCNPRQSHLDKEIRNLKALVKNPVAYAESCVEELTSELSKKPTPRSNQGTPTTWSGRTSFYNGASTSNSPAENGYLPSNAAIQRRLEKLSQYGTSNDVSPIVVGSSARVNKGFTPVTRNNA